MERPISAVQDAPPAEAAEQSSRLRHEIANNCEAANRLLREWLMSYRERLVALVGPATFVACGGTPKSLSRGP